MNTEKDYYAVLGVLSIAEDVVIAGAYRGLAQRYHPDRFDGDQNEANRRMAEINEAYRILSDGNLRAQYDKERDYGGQSQGDTSFELETFRPFAEKLREFGYDESKIREALVGRGARVPVAERLARLASRN
jgi:DnaJ-class molecular chaperone